LEIQDGLLAAAIGWWLKAHHVPFVARRDVGGFEIDFLVPVKDEYILIECKMNYVLNKAPSPANSARTATSYAITFWPRAARVFMFARQRAS
jgi:hypothetical protein